jgi:hypothetical protein
MIVGDIASVPSTKYTSGKIVSKISNSWELNVSYLATLRGAVGRAPTNQWVDVASSLLVTSLTFLIFGKSKKIKMSACNCLT